jgi:alkylation response protein AidB-like acyl-CoA dehydrogenase
MSERHGPLGLSEEQADLLQAASKYCEDKSSVEAVRNLLEDETGHDPATFSEMAELGWLGIAIPESYGGAGLGIAEVVPVVEQMGRRLMAGPFIPTTLAAQLLLVAGTEEQKAAVLPQLAGGAPATLMLAEPDSDLDAPTPQASATRKEGLLSLTGTKCLVVDAHIAQWAIVSVNLDGSPALILLDRQALEACSSRREIVVDETRRAFRLELQGVSVPETALLDPALTPAGLTRVALAGALFSAAEMCGGGQSCIDYTVSYLNSRKQFGRPIGSYQALKHTTVNAHVQLEQARSHLYAAAHTFETGEEGEVAVRMAKATAGPALAFAADRSIQFHGGYGFTYACDAQLYRRRAIWGEAQFGDAVYQRRKLASLIL